MSADELHERVAEVCEQLEGWLVNPSDDILFSQAVDACSRTRDLLDCTLAAIHAIDEAPAMKRERVEHLIACLRARPGVPVAPLQAGPVWHERFRDCYYSVGQNYAPAIRLVGAGDESFSKEVVHIEPDLSPYHLPPELAVNRNEVEKLLRRRAKENNQEFYDGPNTRLIDYRATPVDATEQKHLTLILGPVGWIDYAVANNQFSKVLRVQDFSYMQPYVNLEEIAASGIIRNVALSNILDTATTLVTSDGLLVYSQRSTRVSSDGGYFTSAVAENIHQEKDRSLSREAQAELPSPFRTVLRGIGEELSLELLKHIRIESVRLLGLCFNLDEFHPSLLFAVFLPLSFKEMQKICQEHPGKDFIERKPRILAIPARQDSTEVAELLSKPNWVAGGKSSLIRTIQFLRARQMPPA